MTDVEAQKSYSLSHSFPLSLRKTDILTMSLDVTEVVHTEHNIQMVYYKIVHLKHIQFY